MSEMLTEIQRVVTEDISNRTTQFEVMFEAITNSIQANANHIIVTLHSNNEILAGEGEEVGRKRLDNIRIEDNGDGFTKANWESFCKYRTKHKIELGCKGTGRLAFLKVYSTVNFHSEIVEEQKRKEFKFNINFNTDNLNESDAEIKENKTVVDFENITPAYLNFEKEGDRRIFLDLNEIREETLNHLIPTLFFYKKRGVDITIEFIDSKSKEKVVIAKNDIPDFKEKEINIIGRNGYDGNFILFYNIVAEPGLLKSFHCANNRTVCTFEDKKLKIKFPVGYSGFMLLESEYFDSRVNNDRNDFSIMKIRVDAFSAISWDMINSHIKKVVTELVQTIVPDAEEHNKQKIRAIEEERPYLINYIDEQDLDIAGFLDKKQIIDKAKKRFDSEKERVLTNAGKSEYTNQELQDAIQIAQSELISYINDRVQVIERLQKLVDEKERVEKIIHNLFMQMGTDSESYDYRSVSKNNLWLIDDRFISYSFAASDRKIQRTLKAIGENPNGIDNKLDETDLALFFSHNPEIPEERGLKSVLVEIKPFDYKSKPADEKHAGLQQLLDYVEAFQKADSIKEVHAFLVTDIDEKFAHKLIRDTYKPLFSTDEPIYYRYFETLNISIYVISAKTLIKDAEARNKVFLDIIRKQGKIHKYLKQDETVSKTPDEFLNGDALK